MAARSAFPGPTPPTHNGGCGCCTGTRVDRPSRHLDELTIELDVLLGEEPGHRLEAFLPLGAGLLGVETEAVQLGRCGRTTAAEIDATVAQAVQHRGALGDANGMVVLGRRERETEPEPDVVGLVRRGAEDDLRRGHVREPTEEVMLGQPHVIPTVLVRVHDLIDCVPDDLRLKLRLVGRNEHLVEQTELHRIPFQSLTVRPRAYAAEPEFNK